MSRPCRPEAYGAHRTVLAALLVGSITAVALCGPAAARDGIAQRAGDVACGSAAATDGAVNERPVAREVTSHATVVRQLRAALHRNPHVDIEAIDFEVDGTRVVLRGRVDNWDAWHAAARSACEAGASAVRNEIEVRAKWFRTTALPGHAMIAARVEAPGPSADPAKSRALRIRTDRRSIPS